MSCPPIIIWTWCTIASSFYPTVERLSMLTDAIASPNVRFVHCNLIMECVINRNVCASNSIYIFHDSFEIGSVSAVPFTNVLDKQVGVDHFVLSINQNVTISHNFDECIKFITKILLTNIVSIKSRRLRNFNNGSLSRMIIDIPKPLRR